MTALRTSELVRQNHSRAADGASEFEMFLGALGASVAAGRGVTIGPEEAHLLLKGIRKLQRKAAKR